MKKFPFLLLDAGPIIKLFQLGIWDEFITKCDVTISRIVVEEAQFAKGENEDVCINLESYEDQGHIKIIDVELSQIRTFRQRFDLQYKTIIHAGEEETLTFLCNSSENWLVCAGDAAVFRVLGMLGKGEQGISLEEVLKKIGLSRELEQHYSKRFREKWTQRGQTDSIQDKGFL